MKCFLYMHLKHQGKRQQQQHTYLRSVRCFIRAAHLASSVQGPRYIPIPFAIPGASTSYVQIHIQGGWRTCGKLLCNYEIFCASSAPFGGQRHGVMLNKSGADFRGNQGSRKHDFP